MIDEEEVLIGRIVLRQRFGAAHAQYFDGHASRDANAVTADIAKRGREADYDRIAASRCKHSLAQVIGQIVINTNGSTCLLEGLSAFVAGLLSDPAFPSDL